MGNGSIILRPHRLQQGGSQRIARICRQHDGHVHRHTRRLAGRRCKGRHAGVRDLRSAARSVCRTCSRARSRYTSVSL